GTDTGPRGTFKLTWRRLNRRGYHAELDMRGSELENGFRFAYHLPFQKPFFLSSKQSQLEVVTLGLAHVEVDTDTYDTTRTFAGVRARRLRGGWRETLSFSVHHDDFTVGVDSGEVVSVIPAAEWSLVRSDHRLYPQRGYRLGLEIAGAHESALSDVTVLKAKASAKWVRAFGPEGPWGRRHKVSARGELGAIVAEDFRTLPPIFRFFTGGDQSVRGYDFETLGDLDEAGNVIGGERLFVGSLEYEYLILQKWGAAVFYDTGSAGRDLADQLSEGAGVGVSWRSPVGPVRLDFAWAISEPGEPLRVHLTIGPDL
ncbi:MAG: BamA/TamA family outer membrane protein, partial [Acidobacteriota bacterium]